MKEFKYPFIRLFYDTDEIPCVFVEDIVKIYPDLENEFNKKSWDIDEMLVIAFIDAQDIINIYNYNN